MSRYSRCPDCGKKSVFFSAGSSAGKPTDGYSCRTTGCGFGFYLYSGSAIDDGLRARWQAANPDVTPEVSASKPLTAPFSEREKAIIKAAKRAMWAIEAPALRYDAGSPRRQKAAREKLDAMTNWLLLIGEEP